MRCALKVRIVWVVAMLASASASAQSATQSDSRTTFRISGRITQLGRAVPDQWVSFEGPSSKSVKANSVGHYEADLPLGIWKVVVSVVPGPIAQGHSLSRPRLFQVTTPADVTLDLFARPGPFCPSIIIVTDDGRPPTEEEEERKNESCAGQEFFSVPSNDGTQFEVIVGGSHGLVASIDNDPHKREFGTYNLLTVQADKVVFTPFPDGGLLEATGGAVVNDGHREYRRNSVKFLIGGGQAVQAN